MKREQFVALTLFSFICGILVGVFISPFLSEPVSWIWRDNVDAVCHKLTINDVYIDYTIDNYTYGENNSLIYHIASCSIQSSVPVRDGVCSPEYLYKPQSGLIGSLHTTCTGQNRTQVLDCCETYFLDKLANRTNETRIRMVARV